MYHPVRAICKGPTGYRYTNRPLSTGTVKIGISPCGNKETPRLPAHEQGAASSSSRRTRRRLIFPRGDEAPPRLPARERGATSSSCGETMRRSPTRQGDTIFIL
ncbi:hypothetical protein GW17_00034531 [Ensete ventricosum]|nr:hypothetical protein GW17_00034531 [Ensete ventricosum]